MNNLIKPSIAMTVLLAVSCTEQPTPTIADDEIATVDNAADSAAVVVFPVQRRRFNLHVPITATTLKPSVAGTMELLWPGLDRYTAFAHGRLFFEVPARDGDECDAGCRDKVLARATSQAGTLPAVVTVERSFRDGQNPDGTCSRFALELVTIDFALATHGINPDLEQTYGFLKFHPFDNGQGVFLKKVACHP
jgi:hypothetical protein